MKVVIAGSAKLEGEIKKWIEYWNTKEGFSVSNYPKAILENDFERTYPHIHTNFFKDIEEAAVLFIANGNKNGVEGYIGAETFAELSFGLAQNLVHGRNIKLILANRPAKEVVCYDEVVLWKKLGWIEYLES
jgi:hypothetical protein